MCIQPHVVVGFLLLVWLCGGVFFVFVVFVLFSFP